MEEEETDKGWNSDPLSQSYSEGIKRIIETGKDTIHTFEIPQQVLEERARFWNGLFSKYSEELSDEVELDLNTLKPTQNIEENYDSPKPQVPMRKSPNLIQYWVNTGNLPYNTLINQDTYSDSGSSLSEKELSQLSNSPVRVKDLIETRESKIARKSNSSCSSVDTAAYILSNTNITKKAETMAIVEGAKYSDSVANESIDTKNAQRMCPADTTLSNDKDNIQQNDSNNCSQCFPITEIEQSVQDAKQNSFQSSNIKKVYTVPDYDITFQASSGCKSEVMEDNTQSDADGSRYKSNISVLEQFVVKTSKPLLYEKDSIHWTGCDAEADEINSELEDNLIDTIFDSDKKLLHRKKLYSGRDSPVDLIRIKRTSINRIGKPKKSLHPALEPIVTINRKESLLRRRKRHEKKRQRWSELVSKKLASMSNDSHESHDGSHTLKNLNELEENTHCTEQLEDTSNNELFQDKHKKSPDTNDDEAEEEIFSVTSNEKGTPNAKNTKSQSDSGMNKNNVADKLEKNVNRTFCSIVRLTRLTDALRNKNISQKEMVSDKIKNAVVRLTRLPLSEIKKYKSSRNIINKEDDAVKTNVLQRTNENILRNEHQRRSLRLKSLKRSHNKDVRFSCRIQNINMEDVDSDQSTVFLCECKYGSAGVCSANEYSPLVNNNSLSVTCSSTENNSCRNLRQSVKSRTVSTQPLAKTEIGKEGASKTLRKTKSKGNLESPDKNGLTDIEILNRIKHLEPVVVLERLPQERLRNIRIRRNTRNILSSKRKAETDDTPENFEVTSTSLHTSSKAIEQNKGSQRSTHQRKPSQFCRGNSESPIQRHTTTESSRKLNYTRHHSVATMSSDDETEFVKLIQNLQNSKRPRLRSQRELNPSNITQANVLDTTDDESDLTIVNANATVKRSAKTEFIKTITRRASRSSSSQKTDSEGEKPLKKKPLGSLRKAIYNPSSSESSSSIFTPRRKNSNTVSLPFTKEEKSYSSQTKLREKSFNNVRTPKQNGKISPKKSSNESMKNLGKGSNERNDKTNDSKVKLKTPITRLRFRTQIFESDSESVSMSSNHSLVSENYETQ